MPEGRSWIVSEPNARTWEIKTAREGEVYYRPLDSSGTAKGSWRPGLPPIADVQLLPQSLRDVLDLFAAREDHSEDPC
jgi:hypothetical protein